MLRSQNVSNLYFKRVFWLESGPNFGVATLFLPNPFDFDQVFVFAIERHRRDGISQIEASMLLQMTACVKFFLGVGLQTVNTKGTVI